MNSALKTQVIYGIFSLPPAAQTVRSKNVAQRPSNYARQFCQKLRRACECFPSFARIYSERDEMQMHFRPTALPSELGQLSATCAAGDYYYLHPEIADTEKTVILLSPPLHRSFRELRKRGNAHRIKRTPRAPRKSGVKAQ